MSTGDFTDKIYRQYLEKLISEEMYKTMPAITVKPMAPGGAGGNGGWTYVGTGGAGGANVTGAGGGSKVYIDDYYYHSDPLLREIVTPKVTRTTQSVQVHLDDGSISQVSREELVKYIVERKIREENELVRTQWDRYQVAIKIVGSTDNGQEDEG